MKQRKNRSAAVALVGLILVGVASGAALAADPGTQEDPLVTLSYLNETVTPALLGKVDEAVAGSRQELVDKLNAAIDTYTKQMNDALAQSGASGEAVYSVVSLSAGQTMHLAVGSEVMLRVGSAVCVSSSAPGLIDTTAGSTLNSGAALVKNHLYMATISDRGVKATAAVKVLVRGSYTIA